jgi:Zn-dependent protease with chaperone function
VDTDARVTTAIVGLVVAFCALLLVKWLALVALAALVLVGALRFAVRRTVRAVRARRAARADGAPDAVPAAVIAMTAAPDCSWCGLHGGHRDLHGRPVRPRHAHALPAPSRHAS